MSLKQEDRDLLIRIDERTQNTDKQLEEIKDWMKDHAEEDDKVHAEIKAENAATEKKVTRIVAYWGGLSSLAIIVAAIKVFFG